MFALFSNCKSKIEGCKHARGNDGDANRLCVEVPDGPAGDVCRRFNMNLTAQSGGKLAPADFGGNLRYATVSGSHTNQAMRAVAYGAQHAESTLTTADGALSIDLVDKSFKDAIELGVEWQVIAQSALVPGLLPMLQAAMNAVHQVAKHEDELQCAMKIEEAIKKWSAKNTQPPVWSDLAADVLRSRPRCASSCPQIFMFCMKYSSGLLAATMDHIKANGQSSRILGPETWGHLSADIKGDSQKAKWRQHGDDVGL